MKISKQRVLDALLAKDELEKADEAQRTLPELVDSTELGAYGVELSEVETEGE